MMKRASLKVLLVLLVTAAIASADPKDDVQAAAKKLAGSDNYSWTQTVEGGFGASGKGMTQSDGLTYVSMTFRDNTMEMYFQGEKGAVKTEDGWQSLSDAGQDNGGGFNPARMASFMARNFKGPADQAQTLANQTANLKVEDGVYSGDLTDEGAQSLLRFGRRGGRGGNGNGNGPQVSNAKGTVKFWVNDGVLSKIQYHVTGTVSFGGNDRDVDRTATIEIKDVGTTKIDVPAEAKAKGWNDAAATQPGNR